MIGAIIGDLVSHANSLVIPERTPCPDNTLAIIAATEALLDHHRDGLPFQEHLRKRFAPYPKLTTDLVVIQGPIGLFGRSEQEVSQLVQDAAEVLPGDLRSARAIALAVYLAKQAPMEKDFIFYNAKNHLGSDTSSHILLALEAFLNSDSFTDALGKAISYGGDVLTTGAISFPFFFVDERLSMNDETHALYHQARTSLPIELWVTVRSFLVAIDPYAQADQFYMDYL